MKPRPCSTNSATLWTDSLAAAITTVYAVRCRDMVELPSQINEHWAIQPEVLEVYARHYQTDDPMPEALITKLVNSSHFNQGFMTVEFIAAALLDMEWHAAAEEQSYDVNTFEKNAMKKYGLIDEIIPVTVPLIFHTSSTGICRRYYVYLWAEILDADAFDAFKETGDILTRNRRKIPEIHSYRRWLGRAHGPIPSFPRTRAYRGSFAP